MSRIVLLFRCLTVVLLALCLLPPVDAAHAADDAPTPTPAKFKRPKPVPRTKDGMVRVPAARDDPAVDLDRDPALGQALGIEHHGAGAERHAAGEAPVEMQAAADQRFGGSPQTLQAHGDGPLRATIGAIVLARFRRSCQTRKSPDRRCP